MDNSQDPFTEAPGTFTAEQMEALMRMVWMVAATIGLPPGDPRLGPISQSINQAEVDMLRLFLNATERNRFRAIIKAASEAANKPRIIL